MWSPLKGRFLLGSLLKFVLRPVFMVREGVIDVTAVDSEILDLEFEVRPQRKERLRVVGSWGPSLMLPWMVRTDLPLEMRDADHCVVRSSGGGPLAQFVLCGLSRWKGWRKIAPCSL